MSKMFNILTFIKQGHCSGRVYKIVKKYFHQPREHEWVVNYANAVLEAKLTGAHTFGQMKGFYIISRMAREEERFAQECIRHIEELENSTMSSKCES